MFPRVDEQLCNGCGLCVEVCAGLAGSRAFSDTLPLDPFVGQCLESCVGRSTDQKVYAASQSGGVVSQLLIDALEASDVDACAVVGMERRHPPRPTAYMARTRRGVLDARASKYCPVPLLQVLREAAERSERIALVGLSCHMHGLQMLVQGGFAAGATVKLKVGLICDRTLTLAALDYLVRRAGAQRACNLTFRDKIRTGYPGDVSVEEEDGTVRHLPKSERMAIKDFFTPARCRLCFDKMNVLADVTVGDPWGIARNTKTGECVVVARTEGGRRALECSRASGTVETRPVPYEQVTAGQHIDAKRDDWSAYCRAWEQMGRPLPGYYRAVASSVPQEVASTRQIWSRLKWSLGLDDYASREKLLRHVTRIRASGRLHTWLRSALRLGGRLVRGLVRWDRG